MEHIEYLLLNHNCVIIPQFGAFISSHTESIFYFNKEGRVTPPKRSIGFNEAINHNDGLLANSVVRKEKVTYSVAIERISSEVASWKIQINTNRELQFGKIGKFVLNSENNIEFVPGFNKTDVEHFGLRELMIPTLVERNKVTLTEQEQTLIKESFIKRVTKYAASVVILIALCVTLSTPIAIDYDNAEFASLNLIKQKKELAERIENYEGELMISLPPINAVETISLGNKSNEIATVENNDSYFLIVASLPSEELAYDYIKDSSDIGLKILEIKGKYRIYIASSSDIKSLEEYKFTHNILKKYTGAWICRK